MRTVRLGRSGLMVSRVKCPYQLPIREMIAENLAFYERVAAEHKERESNDHEKS